jgi:acid phosphatase (class A)
MKCCHAVKIRALRGLIIVLLSALLTAGCVTTQKADRPLKPKAVPELRPGLLMGYIDIAALPNSLTLVPTVPEIDSAVFALDQAMSQSFLKLQGTARWDLAITDANLKFPEAAGTFTCSLGAPITETETPYLYQLLRRTIVDAGLSTYRAKNEYERLRPFMQNNEPTCTPEEEAHLRENGSYPSGHTAIGWAWALILSEIAPDRVDTIMARGRAFGDSRMVCNVHWNSDVREGRIVAAAVVAKLHSNPEFRYDLAAAKEEIAAVRAKNLPPTRDCPAETAALAVQPEPQ